MMIDAAALATITAAVSVLGNEYLKGVAGDAGKATWSAVKSLFGWTSDPNPAEIPARVANQLTASPELAVTLLEVLKGNSSDTSSEMVGSIRITGGKVLVAQNIITENFKM